MLIQNVKSDRSLLIGLFAWIEIVVKSLLTVNWSVFTAYQ